MGVRYALGLILPLAALLLPGFSAAQGQALGNGVYACDGAAQAGPCQAPDDQDDASGSVLVVDQYGAHAVDAQWRRMFWVVGEGSSAQARSRALAKCERESGGACQSLGTFQNTCLAYAFDKGGKGDFVGYAPTADASAASALAQCRAKGNGNACYMLALPVCSGIQYRLSLVNMRAKRASAADIDAYVRKIEGSGR